jgi:hypothetical protein
MLRQNDLAERCVCGASTIDPNDDCERCRLVGEVLRLRSMVAHIDGVREGVRDAQADGRLATQSRDVLSKVLEWLDKMPGTVAHK